MSDEQVKALAHDSVVPGGAYKVDVYRRVVGEDRAVLIRSGVAVAGPDGSIPIDPPFSREDGMTYDFLALPPSEYEVLPTVRDEAQEASLSVSYTGNNGIRIQIINDDIGPDWAVFDLEPDLAARVGAALTRWATARNDRP